MSANVLAFSNRVNNRLVDVQKFDSVTWLQSFIADVLQDTNPDREPFGSFMRNWKRANLPNIMRGLNKLQIAAQHGIPTMFGVLRAQLTDNHGEVIDYGIVSVRVVTTVGVNFIVDAFQNAVELETMRYHGLGTNATAEAAGDTALGAELSTVYNPDSTRATGTLAEGASANIYRTVATNNFDGSATITEHGIFSQAATGGGVLLDRSVFGGIAVVSGNSLQTTYDLTFAAGS